MASSNYAEERRKGQIELEAKVAELIRTVNSHGETIETINKLIFGEDGFRDFMRDFKKEKKREHEENTEKLDEIKANTGRTQMWTGIVGAIIAICMLAIAIMNGIGSYRRGDLQWPPHFSFDSRRDEVQTKEVNPPHAWETAPFAQ